MLKFCDGKYTEVTDEEIAEMQKQQEQLTEPEPTQEERIKELEAQNKMLIECLMEMSETVYA